MKKENYPSLRGSNIKHGRSNLNCRHFESRRAEGSGSGFFAALRMTSVRLLRRTDRSAPETEAAVRRLNNWRRPYGLIAMTFMFVFCNSLFAGTVTGKVNFTGAASPNEPISMNADPVCSSLHSEPVFTETVITNSNGTLKNAFVYVKEGLEGKIFPVPVTSVTIDQKGCQYQPHVFGIQVGQPLEIINSDSTLHNIHSLAMQSKQFNLGMPIQGMKLSKKFDKSEVMVKLKCDVHPWMNAYIGVLTHPFYGVTGDEGTFEIKGLPPGDYIIEAWHEKYGTQTQKVTVTDETPAQVEFTFAG